MEDNITVDLKEGLWTVECINLAADRVHWWALVDMAMNP
jgi:hypothetical protein